VGKRKTIPKKRGVLKCGAGERNVRVESPWKRRRQQINLSRWGYAQKEVTAKVQEGGYVGREGSNLAGLQKRPGEVIGEAVTQGQNPRDQLKVKRRGCIWGEYQKKGIAR